MGNLTSQFFANVYLNELDQFVKHELKSKYYIRYVDDFTISHSSKLQLMGWEEKIKDFLRVNLNLELHPHKSKIISLNKPISFLGFRVFYNYKLIRKFNKRNIAKRLNNFAVLFSEARVSYDEVYESLQGSFAYMKYATTYYLRKKLGKKFEKFFKNEVSNIEINRLLKN